MDQSDAQGGGNSSKTSFQPFIPASKVISEFTPIPILMGIVLGILFGASSLYLSLKVGMTVSASIPIAVLAITLFKSFSKILGLRKTTILENNIVQVTGSAGESIAFGVAVTMPALLILGYEMELGRIMLVAVLGGVLGVLMMIPLRDILIVKSHGELCYPEGTSCAQILIAGEEGGTNAKTIFTGFFFGFIYKFLNLGTKLWNDVPEKLISWFKGASISAEVSPELLGVGYIIGFRVAAITVAGGIVSSWILTPIIKLFGDGLTTPIYPATKLISQMSIHEIWKSYILYIGAGAVAAGGIISLIQSLPVIIQGAKAGLQGLQGQTKSRSGGKGTGQVLRTEQDLPFPLVALGIVLLIFFIWMAPPLHMNLLGAVLIVVLGFLFVLVSSRLVGEIGSSSNPISGMTVATLLITSLVFWALGWVEPIYRVTALSVAAVVCIASSNGGTTSQDLKTGFLVGGTPKYQQIGLLFGVLTSALVIGFSLNLLNNASTVYSTKDLPAVVVPPSYLEAITETEKVRDPVYASDHNLYRVFRLTETPKEGPLVGLHSGKYLVNEKGQVKYLVDPGINGVLKGRDDGTTVQKFDAPKARLMSMIIDGILNQKLPWELVLLGVAIAIVLELCKVSSLPFAVGVYLPLSATTPIFCGGLIRWFVERRKKKSAATVTCTENPGGEDSEPGVLFSSGLIAGGSIMGIGLAILSVQSDWGSAIDLGKRFPELQACNLVSCIAFGVMVAALLCVSLCSNKKKRTV